LLRYRLLDARKLGGAQFGFSKIIIAIFFIIKYVALLRKKCLPKHVESRSFP
jgi:hypothetical protein